jgi:outer membrane receptor for ferric coprogen and ferric-rhodotorulic acid
MLGMPAMPQSTGALDLARAIEIPAQPLGEALRGLAKQANLQILFDAALVAGRTSRAIEGHFTARAALAELLHDTALEAYEQAPGVVVIRRRDGTQRGGDAPAPPNPQED